MRRITCVLVLALGAAPGAAAPALAQVDPGIEPGTDLSTATSVREFDTEMFETLENAFTLIAEGRHPEGFNRLFDLFAAYTEQVAPDGPRTYLNIRHAAMLRLLDQPLEVLKAFDDLYGARARERLESAARRRDVGALVENAFDFLPTEAGQRSLVTAADLLTEEGRSAEAARRLRDLLWFVPARALRVDAATVLFRLAHLYRLDADAARLEELREDTLTSLPELEARELRVGGSTTDLASYLARDLPEDAADRDAEWPAFGGGSGRRYVAKEIRTPAAGTPLEPAWIYRHRTTVDPMLEPPPSPREEEVNPRSGRVNPILPVMPVVVDDTIYFADASAIFAVEARTGRTVWLVELGPPAASGRERRDESYHYVAAAGADRLVALVDRPERHLLAVDRFDGAELWTAHAEEAAGAAFLAEAKLTGTPLVIGRTVICGARLDGIERKAYVTAFDLDTGALRWHTFIASGPMLERNDKVTFDSPTLSESGGVITVSTDLGILGAVDAESGEPLWLFRARRERDLLVERRDIWRDDLVAREGRHIFTTLPGSTKLHVLFERPRRDEGHIEMEHWDKDNLDFLIGVADGWVWVIGQGESSRHSEVQAYHPADRTSNEQWRFQIPNPGHTGESGRALDRPLGRGLVVADAVVVPTWKALYWLDRTTGRLLRADPAPTDPETGLPLPFGNIIPAGSYGLLATGPAALVLYELKDPGLGADLSRSPGSSKGRK